MKYETQLKAWISGKSYNFPTHFTVRKLKRGWEIIIFTDDTALANFSYCRKKDLNMAIELILKQLKTN